MIRVLCVSAALLCSAIIANAQEKVDVMRYEYQMTLPEKKESGDEEASKGGTEIIYLDVLNSESRCGSEGNIKREETLIEFTTGAKKDADHTARFQALGQYRSQIQWLTYKNGSELNTYGNSGIEAYNVGESTNLIKWDISPEIEEYNGMKVQKAVGELSGRTWTVWFTQDIPLIDGPYKFKNLPGFVVKAEDSTGDYKFEFLKSEKTSTSYWMSDRHKKAMKVDKKQWDKIRNMNANKSFSQIMNESGGKAIFKVVDDKGKDITDEMTKKKMGKGDKPIEFY
ncbi:GLPGLI family protein [Myroides sp. M-43]|uniref:GLPGLI family protein n=1 Tax=Myroides oncorhynchi TaxID=2893756 RepID=UPI001E4DE686|nr:GLPGLI family protein [Myroides oncorhynchi]MCC9043057.1 GLPGLI family protein [Myroides oncorhynchi]